MGSEVNCKVRIGKQEGEGKALLETSELLFRGDFRLKIPFSLITSIKAANGELRIQTPDGSAVFFLGPLAEKWSNKILHPKSRLEKLGVKPGAKVSLLGGFDVEFLSELAALTNAVTKNKATTDSAWVFFAADSKKDLAALPKIAEFIQGTAALWVVYQKGQKHITENDVLAAGRKTGLKDVKVVGFSSTHTALKFVIPLAQR